MLSLSRSLLSNTTKRKTRTKTKSKAKTKLKANDSVSGKQKIVAKNHQLEDNEEEEEEEEEGFNLKSSAPSNSHGVQPLGNLYFNPGSVNSRNTGLGNLKILSDELVLEILGLLEGTQLGVLATVSKSFYVFTSHEPLWRNLVLDKLEGGFLYNGSWKFTYVSTFHPSFNVSRNASLPGLRVRDFYSDYLFQSWLCANLEMKPEWLESDNIIRKRGISLEDFVMNFEEPNKPVLLEGCMDNWDALKKWDGDYLVNLCGDVRFSVGPVKLRLEEYFRYSDQVKEERPLYLFDPKFAEKVPTLGSEYEVPVYFSEDLFSVLGNERPDYRWIIIGPAGSGSSFHIDPNSTSAWNAVIRGSKKWVLFPPDVVPPGVHPSADGAEVACPVSIIEWFMNFYSSTKNWKKKPIECICKAGEVIFVPNGWWHLVINLEESVAITQNYVSRRNLLNVLDFLKKPNASELVSGTRDRKNLYEKFKNAIKASFPGTIDELTLKAEEKARQKKSSFWDTVTDSKQAAIHAIVEMPPASKPMKNSSVDHIFARCYLLGVGLFENAGNSTEVPLFYHINESIAISKSLKRSITLLRRSNAAGFLFLIITTDITNCIYKGCVKLVRVLNLRAAGQDGIFLSRFRGRSDEHGYQKCSFHGNGGDRIRAITR